MSVRQTIHMMEMQHELNELRAWKFFAEQRMDAARQAIMQLQYDVMDANRIVASIKYPITCASPAIIEADKRQAALTVAEYVYKLMTGDTTI